MAKNIFILIFLVLVSCGLIYVLGFDNPIAPRLTGAAEGSRPPGDLIEPARGLWARGRISNTDRNDLIQYGLRDSTKIVRDKRGVAHIYASNEFDAAFAMGLAIAQDRLFQFDFITRVASGRLSEIMGPSTIETDRYLRSLGMMWAARKNLKRIQEENGLEWKLIESYADGVNFGIGKMKKHQLPLEFQLLNYSPEEFTPLHSLLITQFMSYDLSFTSDHTTYGPVQKLMHKDQFEDLFPLFSSIYVPVIPDLSDVSLDDIVRRSQPSVSSSVPDTLLDGTRSEESIDDTIETETDSSRISIPGTEGFQDGYGSNNWVVGGSRSVTGMPILANDMHLRLTLPSIWYEVHLVTPEANVRGVTFPGIPSVVQGFNDYLSWGFTNTGIDQIDHYEIEMSDDDSSYWLDEKRTEFKYEIDTLHVRGAADIVDTLRVTHVGPIVAHDSLNIAIQWTAHKDNRSIEAGLKMNQATTLESFEDALKLWDCPAQNIVYADVAGNFSIRATGYVPIRSEGNGIGVLDGTRSSNKWLGRIPFDHMPYSLNPEQGYLASANQQTSDESYPYYLGFDWYQSYRSIRINELLSQKEKHSISDFKNYQSDLFVVQQSLYEPLLRNLTDLSRDEKQIRDLLVEWTGNSDKSEIGPIVLQIFENELSSLAWDEFDGLRKPRGNRLLGILSDSPQSDWLDIKRTPLKKENASDILTLALSKTSEKLRSEFGNSPSDWQWGNHHRLLIKHLTGSDQLKQFSRGPYPIGGMRNTLSPAGGLEATHSASWRFIVDFSGASPRAIGINPGGQSGDPLSDHYDTDVQRYLFYEYNDLERPVTPSDVDASSTIIVY